MLLLHGWCFWASLTSQPGCRGAPCRDKALLLTRGSRRWWKHSAAEPGGGGEASSAAGTPSTPAASALLGKGWSWLQTPGWSRRSCTGLPRWNDPWKMDGCSTKSQHKSPKGTLHSKAKTWACKVRFGLLGLVLVSCVIMHTVTTNRRNQLFSYKD